MRKLPICNRPRNDQHEHDHSMKMRYGEKSSAGPYPRDREKKRSNEVHESLHARGAVDETV